jgi:hypothetical protein
MRTVLAVAGLILVAAGCERPSLAPEIGGAPTVEQSLLLRGFNSIDTVIVGSEGIRVGLYHDFSSYDSLRISFTGAQVASSATTGKVLVRIGPANYFTVQVGPQPTEIVMRVNCAKLPKPHSSALTFFAGDQDGQVFLANLRVVGLWSY